MNLCNIKKTFEQKAARGWDTVYVLLDVHGTLIPGGFHNKRDFTFISDDCLEVLKWFSDRKDFRIIIWTSSCTVEAAETLEWLEEHGIIVDYINHNPECRDTKTACFSQKPYFNILIDDKAGFEPEKDWAEIKCQLIEIGEWDKV